MTPNRARVARTQSKTTAYVTVQLRASNDWFNPLIALATHSPYKFTHVDIVSPDGMLIGANICAGIDLAGTPMTSGVLVRPMGYGKPVRTMLLRWECTAEQATHFHGVACGQVGEPFGWGQMFSLLQPYGTGKPWTERDGFYCSELIAYCLQQSGIWDSTVDMGAVSPRDLMFFGTPRAMWSPDDLVLIPKNAGVWCK